MGHKSVTLSCLQGEGIINELGTSLVMYLDQHHQRCSCEDWTAEVINSALTAHVCGRGACPWGQVLGGSCGHFFPWIPWRLMEAQGGSLSGHVFSHRADKDSEATARDRNGNMVCSDILALLTQNACFPPCTGFWKRLISQAVPILYLLAASSGGRAVWSYVTCLTCRPEE